MDINMVNVFLLIADSMSSIQETLDNNTRAQCYRLITAGVCVTIGLLVGSARGRPVSGLIWVGLFSILFPAWLGIPLGVIITNSLTNLKTKVCPNCGQIKNGGSSFNECCKNPITEDNIFRVLPIHKAVAEDRIEDVKRLISSNTDLNAKTAAGLTPLSLAVKRKRPDICNLLRKSGVIEI